MEEKFDYQGKRKDQVESSSTILGLSIIGLLFVICIIFLYKFITTP